MDCDGCNHRRRRSGTALVFRVIWRRWWRGGLRAIRQWPRLLRRTTRNGMLVRSAHNFIGATAIAVSCLFLTIPISACEDANPSTPPSNRTKNSCDPSYPSTCIPPKSEVGDLDCADVSARRFRVTGLDPHGFDRDRDGIGCES
jgi:hypothetical protein